MRIFFYTTLALVAFAMNSILCRTALGAAAIDAASFTTLRLISGAGALLLISVAFGQNKSEKKSGSWLSAICLFLYAIAFSLAYINLSAGTGALILFGSVQATMIIFALASGERPRLLEWLGLILALGGLVYLVFPGLTAPPLWSSILMMSAGAAWGFYTLRGRGAANPLTETTFNFVRAVPFAILTSLILLSSFHLSANGAILALLSGALTSGVGYVIWYAALKGLTATRAATVQLAVPVLAAGGGILLLAESVTFHLFFAAALILGGIGLTLFGRQKPTKGG